MFGPYSAITNIFTSGTFVSFDGLVQALARIQKLDNSTATAVFPSAQPYQTPATWVTPGANVIAPVTGRDGFRVGDWIKIHGISFTMRVRSSILAPVPTPIYEHAHVYWKICAVMYDGSELTDSAPLADECLTLPRFGFSRKLDTGLVQLSDQKKVKTIASGKVKMRLSTYNANVTWVNRYIDLSARPLKVEYSPLSQNGATVERWKPFLVLRSSIPHAPTSTYQIYQPTVNVVTKLHYTDQ